MVESQYLFAYGSLIGRSSDETKGNVKIPVNVSGLKRGWYTPVPEDGNTGLGAVLQEDSCCNGVLVMASNEYFVKTDARETRHGYSRAKLPPQALNASDESIARVQDVWVYLIDEPSAPTQECPIAQSYLDVVLAGCLEISEEFAAEFILTTNGWDSIWTNDRSQPRYRRAISADNDHIDALLRKVIPSQLARRVNLHK